MGHQHTEGREQEALENIADPQNLDISRSEPWLELKRIIASAEQGWETCTQHKSGSGLDSENLGCALRILRLVLVSGAG